MLVVKIGLFIGIVFSVKLAFVYSFEVYEKRIVYMKQIMSFISDLKVYSCTMEMSLDEILDNYNFRYKKINDLCRKFSEELQKEENSNAKYKNIKEYMRFNINTPEKFNDIYCSIINYYGSSYAEVLEKKLSYTEKLMNSFITDYEKNFVDKKTVLNRLSILIGCFAAIILF